MVFITIAVIQEDQSITVLINKIPLTIKTNKIIPTNRWKKKKSQHRDKIGITIDTPKNQNIQLTALFDLLIQNLICLL